MDDQDREYIRTLVKASSLAKFLTKLDEKSRDVMPDHIRDAVLQHLLFIKNSEDPLAKAFSQKDLKGVDLSGLNLSGADLQGGDARGGNFFGTILDFSDIRNARLPDSIIAARFVSGSVDKKSLETVKIFTSEGELIMATLGFTENGHKILTPVDPAKNTSLAFKMTKYEYRISLQEYYAQLMQSNPVPGPADTPAPFNA